MYETVTVKYFSENLKKYAITHGKTPPKLDNGVAWISLTSKTVIALVDPSFTLVS